MYRTLRRRRSRVKSTAGLVFTNTLSCRQLCVDDEKKKKISTVKQTRKTLNGHRISAAIVLYFSFFFLFRVGTYDI